MMSKTYGVSADVWSFGLTLFAVVKGKYPLLQSEEKSNYWDLMRVICDESPPQLDNSFTDNLHNFINSCLFKDPEDRASIKDLLTYPLVKNLVVSVADSTHVNRPLHVPLSEFAVQGKVLSREAKSELSNAMLVKYAHLETVLQKTELKYQQMVEMWNKQGNLGLGNDDSYRSISARSISMKTPAEPMTRLPNFVSGLYLWKHLANQLHLPLDLVLSTASTIINRKYFAK